MQCFVVCFVQVWSIALVWFSKVLLVGNGPTKVLAVNIFTYTIWWRVCVCTKLWKTHTTRNTWSSMSRGPRNNITALHKANLSPPPSQYFNANGSLRTHLLPTQSFFSTLVIFRVEEFFKVKKKISLIKNEIEFI